MRQPHAHFHWLGGSCLPIKADLDKPFQLKSHRSAVLSIETACLNEPLWDLTCLINVRVLETKGVLACAGTSFLIQVG